MVRFRSSSAGPDPLPPVAEQRSTFWRFLLNSTALASASTVLTITLAIPAAYGLVRYRNGGYGPVGHGSRRSPVSLCAVVSGSARLARSLNLGNSLFALAIPYSALSLPLALLLLTAAFEGLPRDLDDAAKLEGMSLMQRLRWVLIPLIAPATASTAILVFLFAWNEYPIALTWLSRSDQLTCRWQWPGSPAHRCTPFPTAPMPLPQ